MSSMENNSKTLNTLLVILLIFTAIFIVRIFMTTKVPRATTSTTTGNNLFCAQVITQAKNDQTGEIKDFPTACIPTGWTRVAPELITK